MADGLDVVAVGVEHERAVVRRVVVRAHARRTEVAPAMRERRGVKAPDRFARRRVERDVEPGRRGDRTLRRRILEADVEGEAFRRRRADRPVADLAGDLLVRDEPE